MPEGDGLELAELGDLAKGLVQQLTGGCVVVAPGPSGSDSMRRLRDEAALLKDAADREAARREYALSVLPPKLRATLAGGCVELTQATRAVDTWTAERKSRVLMIRGGVGVGKSVAAARAVTLSVDAGRRSCSWHRPNDFVSAVLHAYDGHAPKLGGDLVVIDDVGRETKADFCEALCAFIDDYAASILLTTNLTKDQFRERYDVRLIDRLREVGHAVDVKGASRRSTSEEF